MANLSKNTVLIFLLIAAGGVILFLSFPFSRPQNDQGVVLKDIFPPQKAEPLPPMVIETNTAGGHGAGFTIQVYSFQDKNRAENALKALKNRGYQAFLIMSDLGPKGTWYRVRVGGIMDAAAAHKMLDDIRKNYNSGFILKPKD